MDFLCVAEHPDSGARNRERGEKKCNLCEIYDSGKRKRAKGERGVGERACDSTEIQHTAEIEFHSRIKRWKMRWNECSGSAVIRVDEK